MNEYNLRTVSICTGIGGLELGVKSVAKTRTVMYVENEITAGQVLGQRIKEGNLDDAPIWSNLRTFRGEELHGKVDFLIGGFPCQPFSVAGNRLGDDDPRNLWGEVKRIARELGYPALFLENVSNITRYYHDTIRPDLQAMGYKVAEELFSASEVGLPHRRRRLLMLACVTDTDYLKPYLLPNTSNVQGIERSTTQELADCSLQGLQGWEYNQSERRQTSGCGYRLRFAPPTIDDELGWTHTLAHMPEVEPSFCRVVNGLPIGMEQRLRALGNAVVPSMAARGFTELVKKLQTSK